MLYLVGTMCIHPWRSFFIIHVFYKMYFPVQALQHLTHQNRSLCTMIHISDSSDPHTSHWRVAEPLLWRSDAGDPVDSCSGSSWKLQERVPNKPMRNWSHNWLHWMLEVWFCDWPLTLLLYDVWELMAGSSAANKQRMNTIKMWDSFLRNRKRSLMPQIAKTLWQNMTLHFLLSLALPA